jgi:hypothetical protein
VQPATEQDLHPNLHLKVEGKSTVLSYNYTYDLQPHRN